MVWNFLIQAAAGILIGAAVGYGIAAIVETLSTKFADFWEELVATAEEIWGYITEATEYYLAIVAQYLDNNWSEITNWLRQEVGYARSWLVGLFAEDDEAYLFFLDSQERSGIISLGPVEEDVQLPTSQELICYELNI